MLRAHADRLPVVIAARLARPWDFWRPAESVFFMSNEERHPLAPSAGLVWYWLLVPVAVAGAIVLRRGRALLWPLLAPIVLVTLVGAAAFGSTRLRVAAEPSLVALGAVALYAGWRRVRGRQVA